MKFSFAERDLLLTALAISERLADEGAKDRTNTAAKRKECRVYAKAVNALAERIQSEAWS